jgi:antitoxin MazE
MQTTIKKWGNSLAVRLPQHIAADLRIEEGVAVELAIEDNALIVKPARKKYQLAELLKSHKKSQNHKESSWGRAKGKEVW